MILFVGSQSSSPSIFAPPLNIINNIEKILKIAKIVEVYLRLFYFKEYLKLFQNNCLFWEWQIILYRALEIDYQTK
jgi:hypothetical protein